VLVPVLGGSAVLAHGFAFALVPIGLNAVLLAAAGWLFHRISGHSYPHRPAPVAQPMRAILAEDIDAALAEAHEPFDIDREDLIALVAAAARHAEGRGL
jgi:CBS domain-containing membrane protein